MLEILPIKLLRDEDSLIFGSLAVALGKLSRADFPVASGIVVSVPELHLKTVLEHFEFSQKEVFEQTLTLVKKEIEKTSVPAILIRELEKHKHFMVDGQFTKSIKTLWLTLLFVWLEEIKKRLWKDGFYPGITEGLEPKLVIFIKKIEASGIAFFDPLQDDVVINVKQGKLHPNDQRKLFEIVQNANKKLFIPYEYEWIVDGGLKLVAVLPYTPQFVPLVVPPVFSKPYVSDQSYLGGRSTMTPRVQRSAVKVFLDLSSGFTLEKEVDGIYISSEKTFDLNRPQTSFDELVFKLVEVATTFPSSPVLLKLADMSEGMGKIRGTLRLLHQESLFQPLVDALDFVRNKKELKNVHIVVPFVRTPIELLQIKRDLAVKKLIRKNLLELWLEVAVPENIINLEDYLITGVDGVVLNLDELSAYFAGYDYIQQDVSFYKHEVSGLLKFLEDGIKLMHKSKIPFIGYGSLSLNPIVLDFLVEKGVYGLVVERYEAPSMVGLLHQAEKRMILRRSS